MKILIKECKKIMDIRVLLVIAVFTVLFYHLFLEVTIYPVGGQTTDSGSAVPFRQAGKAPGDCLRNRAA